MAKAHRRTPPQRLLILAAAALSVVAQPAAALPAATAQELRQAAHQLDEAALQRYVATDAAEAKHLLAARDLLREAEPVLRGALRERVQRIDFDIGQDAGAAAAGVDAPWLDALGPVSLRPTLDRADLGTLAQRANRLAAQAG